MQNQQKLTINDGLGKLPPQAIEIEEAILGAMMLERTGLLMAIGVLKDSDVFYKEAHRLIFEAVKNLFDIGSSVDILTVSNELRRIGNLEMAGGAFYVSELTTKVNSANNMEHHIRILQEMWMRRLLIKISSSNHRDAYDDTADIFQLFDKAGRQIMKLQEALSLKKGTTGDEIYRETVDEIKEAMLTPGLTGVPCGISEIDDLTGGWQKSDLIVVAARPGMGKTAFAMTVGTFPTFEYNKPVMVFSLEMGRTQLMMRLISADTNISMSKIRRGRISDEELEIIKKSERKLSNKNLIIDDSSGITIQELRAKAITQKIKTPDLAMIIVDYLQLMAGSGHTMNREQDISAMSRGLKNLAKELGIPVIALSQLSRSVETRGGEKRPQLSDLRESGAIEQDADVVVFLYRPEYYKIFEYDDGSSTAGKGDIIFAKHRNGPLATITIGADMSRLKFHSIPPENPFPKPISHPDKFTQPGNIDSFESEVLIKDEYKTGLGDEKAPF